MTPALQRQSTANPCSREKAGSSWLELAKDVGARCGERGSRRPTAYWIKDVVQSIKKAHQVVACPMNQKQRLSSNPGLVPEWARVQQWRDAQVL